MIGEIRESLKSATPYMLRNDGELLNCGIIHPYIKYIKQDRNKNQIVDLFSNRPDHLLWFFNNTKVDTTKRDIIDFASAVVNVNPYNLNDDVISSIKNSYNLTDKVGSQFDIESLFEQLTDETNQEFCRVRTSNIRWGGNDGSIYFRISSIGFNWFNIIWNVVYNNKDFISTVNICKDLQTFGGELTYYRHNNKVMSNMPVDDFIKLSGNPP